MLTKDLFKKYKADMYNESLTSEEYHIYNGLKDMASCTNTLKNLLSIEQNEAIDFCKKIDFIAYNNISIKYSKGKSE